MGDLGDAYAAMSVQKCPCGAQPQGHPSGLCDACVAKRIVDRPAPTPAVAPRYFRVLTDGSTPSWTIIAARPCDAWRLWVDHEDASGFLDGEALGDGETLDPAGFAMNEISAEIAASRMVDDDGTRRPLTECAIGSVFCSEF